MGSELVKSNHLSRKAVVYVRQSTPHQVVNNQESLRLQYALHQRARELGWHEADIDTIDADLGLSGASASLRQGFKDFRGTTCEKVSQALACQAGVAFEALDNVSVCVPARSRRQRVVRRAVLQSVGAVVGYLRVHRGQRFASTTAVTPMTEAFVRNIDQFVNGEGVDLVAFKKGQRKDDVTQKYVRKFTQREGVLYVGKAQEKARVMRTERRCSRFTGGTYPWIVESTAMDRPCIAGTAKQPAFWRPLVMASPGACVLAKPPLRSPCVSP